MNKPITRFMFVICLLCSVVTEASAQGMRNITMHKFVPKGQWIVGSSVSYSQSEQKDYNFLVIESVSGENYTFKISPLLCYAFADNMAAGGRFGYKRSLTKISQMDIEVGEDLSFNMDDVYSLSHSYSGMAMFRNYISLGNSKRFALFAETQLTFEGGQSKFVNGKGDDLTGTFSKKLGVELGVAPGLVAFINNYTAVEVNIGVLGLNYGHTRQITDQIHIANQSSSSINFRINIFSIGMGIAFYL